jgi:hypothetical protein
MFFYYFFPDYSKIIPAGKTRPSSRIVRNGQNAQFSSENLAKATEIIIENPPICYFQVVVKNSMLKFAGGSKLIGFPFLEKADTLFSKENDLDIISRFF